MRNYFLSVFYIFCICFIGFFNDVAQASSLKKIDGTEISLQDVLQVNQDLITNLCQLESIIIRQANQIREQAVLIAQLNHDSIQKKDETDQLMQKERELTKALDWKKLLLQGSEKQRQDQEKENVELRASLEKEKARGEHLYKTAQARYDYDQRKFIAYRAALKKSNLVSSSFYSPISSDDEDDFKALAAQVKDPSISQSKKRSKP